MRPDQTQAAQHTGKPYWRAVYHHTVDGQAVTETAWMVHFQGDNLGVIPHGEARQTIISGLNRGTNEPRQLPTTTETRTQ